MCCSLPGRTFFLKHERLNACAFETPVRASRRSRNHEVTIRRRVVSNPQSSPSLDAFSGNSLCAVAGALRNHRQKIAPAEVRRKNMSGANDITVANQFCRIITGAVVCQGTQTSPKNRGELEDYYLAHSARADLCRRLGRTADACASYKRALSLVHQEPARRFLERRLSEISS
jgi:hypothetical protein